MSQILAVHAVPAPHRVPQAEVTEVMIDLLADSAADASLARRLHANAGVTTRALVLEPHRYKELHGLGQANDTWLEHAPALVVEAARGALERAGVRPDEVDVVLSTTVTGIAVPSLEARVAAELGLREDVVRVPLFGLGCVAGAAGVARANDLLAGRPQGVALLLAVELCSLTVQRDDPSAANLVASGLFGDGAAAVVLGGDERAAGGPLEVVASRSRLYPDTHRAMGWDLRDGGLTIVLGAEVPDLVTRHVGSDVEAFLADQGLSVDDIAFHVVHPGGPKVLLAMQDALGVPREALGLTWESLAEVGNLSSVSVLHVLEKTLQQRAPPAREPGPADGHGAGLLRRTGAAARRW